MNKDYGPWIVLFASFSAYVAYAFALQTIPPLMGQIVQTFGISQAQAGLLMSAVVFPGIFLAIPAGILADRYGVKLIGTISTILVALGSLITAIAVSFDIALVGRFVLGLGGALIVTVMPSVIPQWFPPKKLGKAMGIYGINMPFASVAAFLLASRFMVEYGWRFSLYVGAALALLGIIIFVLLVKEGPLKHEERASASFQQVLKNIEIWKVGIVWLLFNAAVLSFTTWGPKVFEDFQGMDPFSANFLGSMPMLAAIPFVPVTGFISDKIRKRKVLLVIGSLLTTAGLTAVAYSSAMALSASVIALGVFASLIPPIVMTLIPEISGPVSSGTGFGIVAICLNIGVALAPPLIGLILDLTGTPRIAFLAMALFSSLGAVVAYTLKTDGAR